MTEQLNQKALDRIARALGASQPCDPRDLAMQVEVLAELRSKRDLSTATLLEALRVGYEARERGAMLAEVAAEFLRAVPEAADPTREVVKVLKRANYCTWAWAVSRALELLGVPARHPEPAGRPRPEWVHVHIPVGYDIRSLAPGSIQLDTDQFARFNGLATVLWQVEARHLPALRVWMQTLHDEMSTAADRLAAALETV